MTVDEATVRLPLTRERIIQAAADLADEQGIEALSMRRLGQALGVEAMSLYNHVEDKDDILAGMTDWLFVEIGPPVGADDWKASIRETAIRAKRVFAAHAWALPLCSARELSGPAGFALMDAMLELLLAQGYPIELVHHAWHVIASHVMGYAFQETTSTWGSDKEHDHGKAEALMRQYADRFPHVAALAPYLMQCSYDEEFEFGLDIILTGIETRLGAEASAPC